MIEQNIIIREKENPLNYKTKKIMVPEGVKILSDEPYVEELLKLYGVNTTTNDEQLESFDNKQIRPGNKFITDGHVYSVNTRYALIGIDNKYTAHCNLGSESAHVRENLKPGMKVKAMINVVSESEIYASIKDAEKDVVINDIIDSIGDDTVAYKGKVKELISNAGYWVEVAGVNCFMPGSLAGINKLHNFEQLLGKEIIVMPVTFSNEKNTIVVSHRKYLQSLIPDAIDNLKHNMKNKIKGTVTGAAKYGVFVEFNKCLTGLIPDAELVDSKSDYDKRMIKPGDTIEFWIKDVISENKIILTQQGYVKSQWDDAEEKYQPFSEVSCTVKKVTTYGYFLSINNTEISGLLHKSNYDGPDLVKGDPIDVTVGNVDAINKKISFFIKK